MLRVEERSLSGRECVLTARAVPASSSGPVRFAVGRIAGRPAVPAPRPPLDDELCALALSVGVLC
ncbi:hypothetical protein GCM10009801_81910 [Streptomyces albiaxialis]|uniref:Uncharacterized protein n=1 Tax=Streptomyces albiaxialis TaxID=329523 RepID=A0ABN2X6K4_9ACTN